MRSSSSVQLSIETTYKSCKIIRNSHGMDIVKHYFFWFSFSFCSAYNLLAADKFTSTFFCNYSFLMIINNWKALLSLLVPQPSALGLSYTSLFLIKITNDSFLLIFCRKFSHLVMYENQTFNTIWLKVATSNQANRYKNLHCLNLHFTSNEDQHTVLRLMGSEGKWKEKKYLLKFCSSI